VIQKAADIQDAISEGANSFLFTEYKYLGVFMVGWGRSPKSRLVLEFFWHRGPRQVRAPPPPGDARILTCFSKRGSRRDGAAPSFSLRREARRLPLFPRQA
jgi:hypothetical protein